MLNNLKILLKFFKLIYYNTLNFIKKDILLNILIIILSVIIIINLYSLNLSEFIVILISGIIGYGLIEYIRDRFKLSENKYISYIQIFNFINFILIIIILIILTLYYLNINSIDGHQISFWIDNLQEWYNSLSLLESLAAVNISGCLVIVISLFSIIIVLYSEILIENFNLINRYPKFKKIIELRATFKKYYLILDLSIIFIVLIIMVLLNMLVFIY